MGYRMTPREASCKRPHAPPNKSQAIDKSSFSEILAQRAAVCTAAWLMDVERQLKKRQPEPVHVIRAQIV
jgi:hypothetical protein